MSQGPGRTQRQIAALLSDGSERAAQDIAVALLAERGVDGPPTAGFVTSVHRSLRAMHERGEVRKIDVYANDPYSAVGSAQYTWALVQPDPELEALLDGDSLSPVDEAESVLIEREYHTTLAELSEWCRGNERPDPLDAIEDFLRHKRRVTE